MKTMNIIFLIFLILGSLILTTLSSRLRKSEDFEDKSFLEEANNSDVEEEDAAEFWSRTCTKATLRVPMRCDFDH